MNYAEPGKRRSLAALDSTNFFLADVETGLGPFVATFLSSQNHWNPAQIGLATGSQNIASVLAQAPAGWLIDYSHHKPWLVAGAGLMLSFGSLFVIYAKTVPLQVLNQALVGITLAVLLPTISAISLGIVGKSGLSPRIGRNAMFTHAGNTATALLAGYVSLRMGQQWIFYISAALGLAAILSALCIRTKDIDDEAARSKGEQMSGEEGSLFRLLGQEPVFLFIALVVAFHIANASMLPLAGQELSQKVHGASGTYMSACIIIAQLVMAPIALASGKLADRVGRKPLFLIAFSALALRGLLFSVLTDPYAIVAIEVLDGIGTPLAGVTTVLIISDLAEGTGRFNFLQGIAQAALGAGAFVGKLSSGWVAKRAGYSAAFLCLTAVAVFGLFAYLFLMRETLDRSSAKG